MVRRALLPAAIIVSSAFAIARTGIAAEPQPTPEPPSGASIPAGASGAVIVPPKPSTEPDESERRDIITPPTLAEDQGAAYPARAIKDGVTETVTVDVIVDIDANGAVTRAVIEKPAGHGFDEAAIDAAKKLVFRPALRGRRPVASRVRHEYVFAPPTSRITGHVLRSDIGAGVALATVTVRFPDGSERAVVTDAYGAWSMDDLRPGTYHVTVAANGFTPEAFDEPIGPGEEATTTYRIKWTATPSTPEDGQEVVVKGERPPREVVKRTLDQRELSRIPGTNGDALRALQNLPGVARAPGLAGLLIVRGSAPQDTQVFVDGTFIPLVYHFGGLSSVVPTEMIQKIDFYPGNFGAEYGRGMGGIVDVGIKDPGKEKLHGLAQVDSIDARVLAEGPLFNTGWNFAVAGRRSWVDVWLKPVLEQTGAGVTTAPVYYDYQAMLQKDIDKHSSFRMLVLGSDDWLDILIKSVNASAPDLAGGISAHTGFWRAQARYENRFDENTSFRLTSAVGQDFISFSLGDDYFDVTSWPITTRAELSQKLAPSLTTNLGLDLDYEPYKVDVRFPPPPAPGQPPPGPIFARQPLTTSDTDAIYRPGIYDELEITPWGGGRIVPGLRLDYAKDTKQWDLAPRFNARQDVTRGFPRTTLKGGAGVYYQPPQPQETNPVFGQVGLVSNRATEYDVGFEQEITRHVELSMDGFYKQLDHLVTPGALNAGTGRAYGVETLLRWKPDARFFGWLAYTLSRSIRRNQDGEPERLSQFDQTHILTLLGSYRLGRGWEFGARFRLVSGNLYTPQTYGFLDENAVSYLGQRAYPPNGERLPMFHQLDLRVDKVWTFQSWTLSAYLDVQNVYNQGNVEGVSNNYNFTQRTYATGLPILPSLGMRAEF